MNNQLLLDAMEAITEYEVRGTKALEEGVEMLELTIDPSEIVQRITSREELNSLSDDNGNLKDEEAIAIAKDIIAYDTRQVSK